ncbi:MAG: expansin EXLX1 family cellulose-binding protein, partial [Dermatophilaceae bacterium]
AEPAPEAEPVPAPAAASAPGAASAGAASAPGAASAAAGSEGYRTGEGTYYAATGEGNCSFEKSPENMMVAAMNQSDYGNASLCGAFVEVNGPKGTQVVRIVDRCPECKPGDIDLSQQAFVRIADQIDGRVPIRWRIVSPEATGPVAYRFKEGSTQYWTAVQVRNNRHPIAKFEYRIGAGPFKEVERSIYNYFVVNQGMGPGPYTFRVTDIYGHTLTDENIALSVGKEIAGAGSFPAP